MTGHRWNTQHGRYLAAVAALAVLVAGGCSRPDPNPPVRITGDRDAAIPSTAPTSTTSTTVAPTTTFFWGPGGPGEGGEVAEAGADAPAPTTTAGGSTTTTVADDETTDSDAE